MNQWKVQKQKTLRLRRVDAVGLVAPWSHICFFANHLAPNGRLVRTSVQLKMCCQCSSFFMASYQTLVLRTFAFHFQNLYIPPSLKTECDGGGFAMVYCTSSSRNKSQSNWLLRQHKYHRSVCHILCPRHSVDLYLPYDSGAQSGSRSCMSNPAQLSEVLSWQY